MIAIENGPNNTFEKKCSSRGPVRLFVILEGILILLKVVINTLMAILKHL